MLFFAQAKFRKNGYKTNPDAKKNFPLDDAIYIEVSESQWVMQRLKSIFYDYQHAYFNKIVRDLFYQEYFEFMNLRYLKKVLTHDDESQIKDLTFEFMLKLDLSEDDYSSETLLRNYRRYRNSDSCDLYDLLEAIDDF
ncbi:hypothetical protein [Flectobacillus roseus]|uniref:hypothetical protein n=1 Tax=Flectobacillus roseus TaxID=502259 RepID=UPI0024B869B8|nr:hypothetical protein [Flectobacillus roseus]MDI9870560.1 hypothetical protein [Flectobacillus roseus]